MATFERRENDTLALGRPGAEPGDVGRHIGWVRARLAIDHDMHEWIRHGLLMIAAGFGSFAVFEGVTVGEAKPSELPRGFALAVTAVGVVMILLALRHGERMTEWVNADEFDGGPAPELPDERRPFQLGATVVAVGIVSFVALLFVK